MTLLHLWWVKSTRRLPVHNSDLIMKIDGDKLATAEAALIVSSTRESQIVIYVCVFNEISKAVLCCFIYIVLATCTHPRLFPTYVL